MKNKRIKKRHMNTTKGQKDAHKSSVEKFSSTTESG